MFCQVLLQKEIGCPDLCQSGLVGDDFYSAGDYETTLPHFFISALGSVGAGLLAYGLSRKLGRRAVLFIAGEKGIAEGERLFGGETGGWLVAFLRWMPVLPVFQRCHSSDFSWRSVQGVFRWDLFSPGSVRREMSKR